MTEERQKTNADVIAEGIRLLKASFRGALDLPDQTLRGKIKDARVQQQSGHNVQQKGFGLIGRFGILRPQAQNTPPASTEPIGPQENVPEKGTIADFQAQLVEHQKVKPKYAGTDEHDVWKRKDSTIRSKIDQINHPSRYRKNISIAGVERSTSKK